MKTTHNHRTPAEEDNGEHLIEDAQALLTATAHVAEEKVIEARRRLVAAVEKGRESLAAVQQRAVAGAKATDKLVRAHPYRSLGIALGVGVIAGYLLGRRNRD